MSTSISTSGGSPVIKRDQVLERTSKKLKLGQEHMMKTKECLKAANKEIGLRRQECDEALAENQRLKKLLQDAKTAEKAALKGEEQMRQQIGEMNEEYQRKIEELNQHMKDEIMYYQDVLDEEKKRIANLDLEVQHRDHIIYELKVRFSNLAGLANLAIEDVPRYLEMVEQEIIPFKTPDEIHNFINYYRDLIRRMKQMIVEKRC